MKVTLPNKSVIASFDVDCQNTFTPLCADELPVPEGDLIAPELNRQAEFAAFRIGSKEAHHPNAHWIADPEHPAMSRVDGDNMDIRWPAHAILGSFGFDLIEGLPPVPTYNFFVWKGIELDMHPYGSCYHDHAEHLSTGVIEFLKQNGVDTILMGGLTTDYCVKTTTLQLCRAGFKVILNLAATRGITDETVQAALQEMQQAGVEVVDSCDDYVKAST